MRRGDEPPNVTEEELGVRGDGDSKGQQKVENLDAGEVEEEAEKRMIGRWMGREGGMERVTKM